MKNMIRVWFTIVSILLLSSLLSSSVHAQSATLTWTLSTSPQVISQNIYRSTTGLAGSFVKLAAGTGLSATTKSFTDSTVADGGTYYYYVTAVCPTTGACIGESAPSNIVNGTIPGSAPAPPTGLTITNLVASVSGKTETIMAAWHDSPGRLDSYTLIGANNKILSKGTNKSSLYWSGKIANATNAHLTVCDSVTCETKMVVVSGITIGLPGQLQPGY